MDVLRGAADGERHAGRAPHRGPGLQGPLPAVQDHAGVPRHPQGRLGLPRAARRGRRGEGTRAVRQEGHRDLRRRRVQRAVPRVGAAARGRVRRAHHADGLLDRPVHRLPHHGRAVRGVRLVGAEDDLRQGPAGQGLPDQPVLPAVRHPAVRPRDGAAGRLPGGHRPLGDRAVPGHVGPRGRQPAAARGRPAGLDDDAVDAGVQHRDRRPPRRRLRDRARSGGTGVVPREEPATATRSWSPRRCGRGCSARAGTCSPRCAGSELLGAEYTPPFGIIVHRRLRTGWSAAPS